MVDDGSMKWIWQHATLEHCLVFRQGKSCYEQPSQNLVCVACDKIRVTAGDERRRRMLSGLVLVVEQHCQMRPHTTHDVPSSLAHLGLVLLLTNDVHTAAGTPSTGQKTSWAS